MSVFHGRVLTMPRAKISLVVTSASVNLVTREVCVIRKLMNVCYLRVKMELLAGTK